MTFAYTMSKDAVIYVRVPAELYTRLEREAGTRGETLSVIVREACREYLDTLTAPVNSSASPAFQAIFDAGVAAARAGQSAAPAPVQPVNYSTRARPKTRKPPAPKKKV